MDTKGTDAYTAAMTLGERVRALRNERGWTQAELARRSGLNNQTVHRIEHGVMNSGWQSRLKLARAFGIPVAALDPQYKGEQQPEESADGTRRVSSSIALASLTEQQILDGIAAFVRELERRQGRHPEPHRLPHGDDADKPPPGVRRNRRDDR